MILSPNDEVFYTSGMQETKNELLQETKEIHWTPWGYYKKHNRGNVRNSQSTNYSPTYKCYSKRRQQYQHYYKQRYNLPMINNFFTTKIEQIGDKNIVINNLGAVVFTNDTESLITLQTFSKIYYQLLVIPEDDNYSNNTVIIPANKALCQCYVPPEILERCSSLTEAGIAELKTFPALICKENTDYNGITDPNQFALFCCLTNICKSGRNIKIAFHPINALSQTKIYKYATLFDINISYALTDLNINAWSVHKINLFNAFDNAGINYKD